MNYQLGLFEQQSAPEMPDYSYELPPVMISILCHYIEASIAYSQRRMTVENYCIAYSAVRSFPELRDWIQRNGGKGDIDEIITAVINRMLGSIKHARAQEFMQVSEPQDVLQVYMQKYDDPLLYKPLELAVLAYLDDHILEHPVIGEYLTKAY